MSRTLAGVLVGLMVLALAGVAAAGIPDPDNSEVYLGAETGDDVGMCSCPAGDGPTYEYITVEAKRADASPIEGISYGSFFFTALNMSSTLGWLLLCFRKAKISILWFVCLKACTL